MEYLYLALAVITSGYSGVAYAKLSRCSKSRSASVIMPVLWYSPLLIIFGIYSFFTGFNFSPAVVWPALLAGISYAVCAFSLLESMKANSFSLTIIIVNLSFVFPVVFSMLFLKEKTGTIQLIGMMLAIAVILILNVGKNGGKSTFAAIMLAVGASLGNGVIDFAIKIQQNAMPGEASESFFFLSYLFACLFCLVVYLPFHLKGQKATTDPTERKELITNALAVSICNGVCFFAIGLLAEMMNAAAQFTVITSLSIVVSLVLGYFQMHTRFTKRELVSFFFCAVAIACQYFNL